MNSANSLNFVAKYLQKGLFKLAASCLIDSGVSTVPARHR